jgi:hypothetical protein
LINNLPKAAVLDLGYAYPRGVCELLAVIHKVQAVVHKVPYEQLYTKYKHLCERESSFVAIFDLGVRKYQKVENH